MKNAKRSKKAPKEQHPVVSGFLNAIKPSELESRKVLVDAHVLDVLFIKLQELEIARIEGDQYAGDRPQVSGHSAAEEVCPVVGAGAEVMTEAEAEAEEFRLQPEVHASDFFPDELYFDEPQPVNKVFKPAITEREIQARALRFAGNILFLSRTHRAGQLRLLAARLLITGSPTVEQIMRRMGVSKRQVQRALRFVRAYCGVPRKVARATE